MGCRDLPATAIFNCRVSRGLQKTHPLFPRLTKDPFELAFAVRAEIHKHLCMVIFYNICYYYEHRGVEVSIQ